MRQYRGLTKDGKWVYGYFFQIWCKTYILWGTTNDIPNMTQVIPETVGQQVGLKEIYQGDIITYQHKAALTKWTAIVVWDDKRFRWGLKQDGEVTSLEMLQGYHWEIIGNVHQPELLEKPK